MLEHPEGYQDRVGETLIVIGQSAGNNKHKTNQMNKVKLKPDESLPKDIFDKLTNANAKYSISKDFNSYKKQIKEIFELDEPKLTDESQIYLAGFIEGEGSLNVSIKKLATARFGVVIDPEFSITQHVNGVSNLYLAMCVFNTGRLSLKSGSKATLVYRISDRTSLITKVMSFFDSYVTPYGSEAKRIRKSTFCQILVCFENRKHLNLDTFITEILPLWDELRMQKGQSNESFKSLEDAVSYVTDFVDTQEN